MSVKAFVFDAYGTLFDVHTVMDKLNEVFPDKGEAISQEWRRRQVHYFMIRQLIEGYKPFDDITRWALIDALKINNVNYSYDQIEALMEAYKHLTPYDEVKNVLDELNNHQKELVIFSNGTMDMLEPLLSNNEMEETIGLLSADQISVYKPDPRAYQFASDQLGLAPKDILFMSSNPWDIAGANSFGFQTAWINRGGTHWPELGLEPDHEFDQLKGLLSWT